jgi:hypothetical protein
MRMTGEETDQELHAMAEAMYQEIVAGLEDGTGGR